MGKNQFIIFLKWKDKIQSTHDQKLFGPVLQPSEKQMFMPELDLYVYKSALNKWPDFFFF